jgi:leader peptidase (prepilin peptidase) / N-methyltransferase
MFFFGLPHIHPLMITFLAWPLSWLVGHLSLRQPKIMENTWKKECHEFLKMKPPALQKFGVLSPRPHCECPDAQPLKWQHNIPIFSFIAAKGCCPICKTSAIPKFYLTIELLFPLLTWFTYQHFYLPEQAFAAILFTWAALLLGCIDYRSQLLPDHLTLSMLWLGLLCNSYHIFIPLGHAVWGAAFGYILPWSIAKSYSFFSKKEGMGYGDFKILAMFGAWFGAFWILTILMLASFIFLGVAILLKFKGEPIFGTQRPFGPMLVTAAWCHLMWGSEIVYFFLGI